MNKIYNIIKNLWIWEVLIFWIDFRIHTKFLRGKNRGEKQLSSSQSIPLLLLLLITADWKGQSRKEGLGYHIHTSKVLWKTVLYLLTRGKQIDNWIIWTDYWLILQNDLLPTYVIKIIFSSTHYGSVRCLSLISLWSFHLIDLITNPHGWLLILIKFTLIK